MRARQAQSRRARVRHRNSNSASVGFVIADCEFATHLDSPDLTQYRALLEACDELCSLKSLTPRKLFLWIEYAAPTEGPDRIFHVGTLHALTVGCAHVVRAAT